MTTSQVRPKRKSSLRKDYLQAIGLLVTEWASFEMILSSSLAHFITADSPSQSDSAAAWVVTHGMEARVKLGLLKSIVRLRWPDKADGFDRWADEVLSVKKLRDLAAHSLWVKGTAKNHIRAVGMTTVGRLQFTEGEYRIRDFEDRVGQLRELSHDLAALLTLTTNTAFVPISLLKNKSPELAPAQRILKRALKEQKNEFRSLGKASRRPKSYHPKSQEP